MFGINIMTKTDYYCGLNKILTYEGAEYQLSDIGDDVFEGIRIERGVPLFNHEIKEDFNPLELGLKKYIDFSKGCYPGQEVVLRLDSQNKVKRELCGLVFHNLSYDERIKMDDQPGIYINEKKVGLVTSIGCSFEMYSYIGLCLLDKEYARDGLTVLVDCMNSKKEAHITKLSDKV